MLVRPYPSLRSFERTFLFAVAPLADLHGGGEAEAGDRHVHGDPRGHLGVLCKEEFRILCKFLSKPE